MTFLGTLRNPPALLLCLCALIALSGHPAGVRRTTPTRCRPDRGANLGFGGGKNLLPDLPPPPNDAAEMPNPMNSGVRKSHVAPAPRGGGGVSSRQTASISCRTVRMGVRLASSTSIEKALSTR